MVVVAAKGIAVEPLLTVSLRGSGFFRDIEREMIVVGCSCVLGSVSELRMPVSSTLSWNCMNIADIDDAGSGLSFFGGGGGSSLIVLFCFSLIGDTVGDTAKGDMFPASWKEEP